LKDTNLEECEICNAGYQQSVDSKLCGVEIRHCEWLKSEEFKLTECDKCDQG